MSANMTPKNSQKLLGRQPRIEKERGTQEPMIEDAGETEDRDLAHGEGGTIDLPAKPGHLSQDD